MLCSLLRIRYGALFVFSVRVNPHRYMTCQSSSFVGPLAVGLIADLTGNIRYGFFFVVIMIWVAVPILMSVDAGRGRTDAESYSYRTSDS